MFKYSKIASVNLRTLFALGGLALSSCGARSNGETGGTEHGSRDGGSGANEGQGAAEPDSLPRTDSGARPDSPPRTDSGAQDIGPDATRGQNDGGRTNTGEQQGAVPSGAEPDAAGANPPSTIEQPPTDAALSAASMGPDPSANDAATEPTDDSDPVVNSSTESEDPVVLPVAGGNPAGGPCRADLDCLGGMFCLQQDSEFFARRGSEGSIAGGFCTARCETNGDLCQSFGSLSTCIVDSSGTADDTSDDIGYCMEYCELADGRSKCGDSFDQQCRALSDDGQGACFPLCLDDAGCAAGYFCDPLDGLCRDSKPEGNAIAEACSEDADCASDYCLKVAPDTDPEGLCAADCTFLGVVMGCGRALPGANGEAPPPDAVCLPRTTDYGLNDPGVCFPVCDENADCKVDTLQCSPLGDDLASAVGRAGLCVPVEANVDGGAATEPTQ